MFKKLLKGFGIVFLIFICLFVFIVVWLGYKFFEYEKMVIFYMDIVIVDIFFWELGIFKSYFILFEVENINEDDFKRFIKVLLKMGVLVEIGEY